MKYWFAARDDGTIDAHYGPGDGVLDDALNDAVSSRAPRRAKHQGLSTYWIDCAEARLRSAIEGQSDGLVASGNVTMLEYRGGIVVASYEFDQPGVHEERVAATDLLALLADWRDQVIAAGGAHGDEAALVDEPPPRRMGTG